MIRPLDCLQAPINLLDRVACIPKGTETPTLVAGHVYAFTGFGKNEIKIVTDHNIHLIAMAKKAVVLPPSQTPSYELAEAAASEQRFAEGKLVTYSVPTGPDSWIYARFLGQDADGFHYITQDGEVLGFHSNHQCKRVLDCDFETEARLDRIMDERAKAAWAEPRSEDPETDN